MDGKLLMHHARRSALGAAICGLSACGPRVDGGTEDTEFSSGDSTSISVTTDGGASLSSGGTLDASTSTTLTSASTSGTTETSGSTGIAGEVCPQPEEGSDAVGGIYSVEMETGVPHEVECEGVDWFIRETENAFERVVELACTLPEGGAPREVELVLTTDRVDAELQAMVGQLGLQLAYWQEGADFVGNPTRSGRFALRNVEGALLVLSYHDARDQNDDDPLTEFDVGKIWYLANEPEKQAAWNDPFGEMFVRDVGCAARPGTRPYLDTEIPWALQFDSGVGQESLLDQSTASVEVGGQTFRVFVAAGYDGTRSEEVKFPGTRSIVADFLIVRAIEN